jgi:hypothetical protein
MSACFFMVSHSAPTTDGKQPFVRLSPGMREKEPPRFGLGSTMIKTMKFNAAKHTTLATPKRDG